MSTEVQLMTADELLAMPDDGFVYELIKGELIPVSPPPGHEHGLVAMNIAGPLYQFAKSKKLGNVHAAETGFLLEQNPDTVRAPDVAFIRRQRIEKARPVRFSVPNIRDFCRIAISSRSNNEYNGKWSYWQRQR
jgi:Uma2 family endonuclease